MNSTREQSLFRVGDQVRIDLGRRKVTGVIAEDRGAIGVRGRRLYRVDVPIDPFEPMSMELPEDEIEALNGEKKTPETIDKAKIMEYLTCGGLIAILRSNISGGKNQPRAWLCLDSFGNVTHTFVPERGLIGGRIVPPAAVHEDKVFKAKLNSVLTFLESFELNHADAEKVVADVGTAP